MKDDGPINQLPFIEFLKTVSAIELAALRHDAISARDDDSKKVIDDEFKRREREAAPRL